MIDPKLVDKANIPELVEALLSASTVSTAWGKLMQDAADAIETLNSLLDVYRFKLKGMPHWVSVEQPPKEEGKYVAINTKTNWWYEANYKNGVWKVVDFFEQRWVVIHPTHWMPIEPPQEVQE